MRAVDAGYLSWHFGVMPNNGGWNTQRFRFLNDVFCMDTRDKTWRERYFPEYKERRRLKRADNAWLQEKTEKVRRFQDLLRVDPIITTLEVSGAEGDDLVALLWLQGHVTRIVGEDKDFLQIGGISGFLHHHDGTFAHPNGLERAVARWPKSVQPVSSAEDFLFTQVMMGDKSDSVPRLLPLRRFDILHALKQSKDPWNAAHGRFGEDFERNLMLLLIPAPYLLKDWVHVSFKDILLKVMQGTYWRGDDFLEVVQETSSGDGMLPSLGDEEEEVWW